MERVWSHIEFRLLLDSCVCTDITWNREQLKVVELHLSLACHICATNSEIRNHLERPWCRKNTLQLLHQGVRKIR